MDDEVAKRVEKMKEYAKIPWPYTPLFYLEFPDYWFKEETEKDKTDETD